MIGKIASTGSGAIFGASLGISLIDRGFTGAFCLIISVLVAAASVPHLR